MIHHEPESVTAPSASESSAVPPTVLRCESVHTAYFQKPILQEISCEIKERQVTAILGPSGCGKTTLLKTLNRTLELVPGARLTQGRLWYRGRNLYAPAVDPRVVRRVIGIVQQRPVIFPMSILENVLFGLRFHGLAGTKSKADWAREYLTQAGLWDEVCDRLNEPASRLSIGQQQRLCIARTLATQPEVLLMDEPCSALDPTNTQRIEDLIHDLKRRYTVVIVTHNTAQARRIADECLFLLNGWIVATGPTAAFFESPANSTVADFVQGRIG